MEDKKSVRSVNVSSISTDTVSENTESYKKIPEDQLTNAISIDANQNQKRDSQQSSSENMTQEDNNVNDGADEQMLGVEDNEKLAGRRDEVKFIKGDRQNGDAKIDMIVTSDKAFTGMTKEELMKYANDPFWVKLRWTFFIGFWLIWVLMLVGSIYIIVQAPKCAAPEPLPWYKKGPLVKANLFQADANEKAQAEHFHASGVIYELPPELTYSVKKREVEQKIAEIVAQYKDEPNVHVIMDITPNFVGKESQMMQNALADRAKRSAFIWVESPEVPNNWVSTVNGSAWTEVEKGNWVLSQFGTDRFDLHMNDTIVKKELSDVLTHLIGLGVNGFRLKNSKFFLLTKNIRDEEPAVVTTGNDYVHTQYGFWTHTQTTFQEGLGDVLYDYLAVVKNASATAFLSVADDVVRPEVYKVRSGASFGVDIPIYKGCKAVPTEAEALSEQKPVDEPSICDSWVQRSLDDEQALGDVDPSAYALYVALLPGVPVISLNNEQYRNVSVDVFKHIEQLRQSASYMHGEYAVQNTGNLAAYSRIKASNPGYLVIMNPTDTVQMGNFSTHQLPEKMTVDYVSSNYNHSEPILNGRTSLAINDIPVTPGATIILTYVPVK